MQKLTPRLANQVMFAVNRQIEGVQVPLQNITLTTFSDSSLANYGPDGFITKYSETYYDPSDNVTWSKGKHLFNIGISYRYGQDNGGGVTGPGPNGTYVFSPGTALNESVPSTDGGPALLAGSASPNGLISMMTDSPASYSRSTAIPGFGPQGGGVGLWGMRRWHLAAYIQDDWKLTPALTVNLGLRYEYASVPYEIENRFGGVADTGPLYGHFVMNPTPLYQPQRSNFSPRVGAAYSINRETVIRGGFAVLTNFIPNVYPDEAGVDFPLASLSTITNPTYSLDPLSVTLPPLTSTAGTVLPPNGNAKATPPNTPVNLAPIAALLGPIEGYWASNQLKNGTTLSGNLTLERQLPSDMALQATYITSHALDLYSPNYSNAYTGAESQYTPFTNVTPGLGEFQLQGNSAISHYNALQLQLRKNSASWVPVPGFLHLE